MSLKKLKLKEHLRLMIPRLATEANQLKDPEARTRWMKLRKIALVSAKGDESWGIFTSTDALRALATLL